MSRLLVVLAAAVTLLAAAVPAHAQLKFAPSVLSGAQEVPDVASAASGKAKVKFAKDLSKADVSLKLKNVVDFTFAHLHCARAGVNGPVVVDLTTGGCVVDGDKIDCTLTNDDVIEVECDDAGQSVTVNNLASLAFAARDGLVYFNVHTVANAGGEIRAQVLPK